MTRDDMEIVSAVHRALAGRVGQERFAVWFGRGVRMEPCGTTLRIAAADPFRLDFLRRTFRADLIEAASLAAGIQYELEFVVDEALSAAAEPAATQPAAGTKDGSAGTPECARTGDAEDQAADHAAPPTYPAKPISPLRLHEPEIGPKPAKPSAPKRQFASLNEFVVSEQNRVAFSAAHSTAHEPGTYSPLTFVGPPGTGKTHLLEGIWRHVRLARSVQHVLYFTAEQFTNQYLYALNHSGMPNFRRKMRDAEMLLIDDVQFFAGKQSTQLELVHTIDALARDQRQLVFSADRPPSELKSLGPELVARLTGGLVCTLHAADASARLGILRQLATRQSVSVPEEVLAWLAEQLEGDARHLAGALNRLRAASDAHAEPITLPFAQSALDDLVHVSRRPVRVNDIVDAVCDVFGVEAAELQSESKATSVTLPRMLAMFLARKWTPAALSEISRSLNRKSHSTVVSAEQKVTQWLASGKIVPLAHRQCKVEDAIKRVECRLRLA